MVRPGPAPPILHADHHREPGSMESPHAIPPDDEAALIARVRAIARRIARQQGTSHDRADDIAQDVAFACLMRVRTGEWRVGPEALESHIAAIVLARKTDLRRRRIRTAARDALHLSEISDSTHSWMSPDAAELERELTPIYVGTRDSLPEGCRNAFIAVCERDLSYAQAATELGITIGAVSVQVAKARRAFRAALRRRAIAVPLERLPRAHALNQPEAPPPDLPSPPATPA